MGGLCSTPEQPDNPNAISSIDIRNADSKKNDGNSSANREKISLDHFKFLKCIGSGSFGKVFLVEKINTQNIYAMKILKKEKIKSKTQISQTRAERFVLENLDSPFIVQLAYAFQSQLKLYIVMEFCQGGDIFGHMVKYPFFKEEKIRFYAVEMFLALEKLHENNIIYRDLKPENILVTASGHIKLADFGLSKKLTSQKDITYSFCGTAEYMAPEIIEKIGHGISSDWWSYGAVLFEMQNGAPPFYENDKEKMMQRIVNEDIEIKKKLSPEFQSFIGGLLQRKREKRLGCGTNGTQQIREHPFFENVNWQAYLNRKIEPPFVPKVSDQLDLRNIDHNFLKMNSKDTFADHSSMLRFSKKNDFHGFTYEPDLERSHDDQDSQMDSQDDSKIRFDGK